MTTGRLHDSQRLDGNSLAGPMSALFRFDPTMAVGQCASCGDTRPLGGAIVYRSDMGQVVRCPACDAVLMTEVQTATGLLISARGLRWLQISTDAESATVDSGSWW